MRDDLAQAVDRGPGQREQRVVDADDGLPDEVEAVPEVSLMLPACELSIGTRPQRARPTSTASNTVRMDGSAW